MRRVALLVGNSTFAPNSQIQNLCFPTADVEALADILNDADIGRFDRVVTMVDKRANEVLETLNELLDDERGASMLFYYSGHGKPSDDGRLYLAASNTTERRLPSTGIPFASVLQMKETYGFGRFAAILDCCFAGLGSPDIRGSEDDQLKAFAEGRGVFFLGAANATTAAKEDSELGHGVLTAAILNGLRSGLADVDGDGRVTGPNLFAWCSRFAEQRGSHRPIQVNRVSDDDLVIAYSYRRLPPATVERVRATLTFVWDNRLLPSKDIDELRQQLVFPQIVLVPPPDTFASAFLAYVDGKIDWEEFRNGRNRAGAAAGTTLPPPPTVDDTTVQESLREIDSSPNLDVPPDPPSVKNYNVLLALWALMVLTLWIPMGFFFAKVLKISFDRNSSAGNSGAFLAFLICAVGGVQIYNLARSDYQKRLVLMLLLASAAGAIFFFFFAPK